MALLNVIVNELPRVVRQISPLRMLLAVSTADAAAGATDGDVAVLTATNAEGVLGAAGTVGRRWYEALEAYADFHLASLLYDPTDNASKAASLTAFTGDPEAVDAAGGSFDAILWPDDEMNMPPWRLPLPPPVPRSMPSRSWTATTALAATDRRRPRLFATNVVPIGTLAVSNGANFNGAAENGSVIAAAHIARYVGIRGHRGPPVQLRPPAVRSRRAVAQAGLFGQRRFGRRCGPGQALPQLRHSGRGRGLPVGRPGEIVDGHVGAALLRQPDGRPTAWSSADGRSFARGWSGGSQPSLLDTVVDEVEHTLLAEYGRFVESVSGGSATVSGDNHLNVRTGVKFHGFAETVELTIDAI